MGPPLATRKGCLTIFEITLYIFAEFMYLIFAPFPDAENVAGGEAAALQKLSNGPAVSTDAVQNAQLFGASARLESGQLSLIRVCFAAEFSLYYENK